MLNNIYVKECIIFKKLHFYTVNEQKKVHCQDKHKWLFILASILNSSFKKPTVGFIHFLTDLN